MFNVKDLRGNEPEMMSALYLQVSIMSQALNFMIRSRSWSFAEWPEILLVMSFMASQFVSIQNMTLFLFLFFISFHKVSSMIHNIDLAVCNNNRGLRKLGNCENRGNRMGMGWCYLALQHQLLSSIRPDKIHDPLYINRKSLGLSH